MLVPYGKVANFSISSNCDGASQASANGWWECDIDLENLGESYGGVVNASAPSAVNVVVSHLPFMVVPGGSDYFEVTGQLGYTGSVAVYFELYA